MWNVIVGRIIAMLSDGLFIQETRFLTPLLHAGDYSARNTSLCCNEGVFANTGSSESVIS